MLSNPYWPIMLLLLFFVVVNIGLYIYNLFKFGFGVANTVIMAALSAIACFVLSAALLIWLLNLIPIGIDIGGVRHGLGTIFAAVFVIFYIIVQIFSIPKLIRRAQETGYALHNVYDQNLNFDNQLYLNGNNAQYGAYQ